MIKHLDNETIQQLQRLKNELSPNKRAKNSYTERRQPHSSPAPKQRLLSENRSLIGCKNARKNENNCCHKALLRSLTRKGLGHQTATGY
ncbi:hypothetical protein [Thalassotalea litorea]|uniref:hypothetical protein n=1 Tax=Thalassotalea litorea TaxID=2020715 RepID=UPI00373642DE